MTLDLDELKKLLQVKVFLLRYFGARTLLLSDQYSYHWQYSVIDTISFSGALKWLSNLMFVSGTSVTSAYILSLDTANQNGTSEVQKN